MPSKVISLYSYDPVEHRLDVQFVSGRRYRYYDVPKDTYAEMRRAFSTGEYFNANVRDHFRYTREN